MKLIQPNVFDTKVTLCKDVTSYGNRFYLQLEDSETEDHSFLRDYVGKEFKATVTLVQPLTAEMIAELGIVSKKKDGE